MLANSNDKQLYKVAFLGLGTMGYPMAGHLVKKYPTFVWNRTLETAKKHQNEFHSIAVETLDELVSARVIFSCLPTDKEVLELARKIAPKIEKGMIWVDHSTISPKAAEKIADYLSEFGHYFLDAPVSGAVFGAKEGTLTVMVGGAKEIVEKARPVIESFAAKIIHAGPVGAGSIVKAANQVLIAANMFLLGEVMAGVQKSGVNVGAALEVINASTGRSFVSERIFGQRVLNRSFPNAFKLGLMVKDLNITAEWLNKNGSIGLITDLLTQIGKIAMSEIGEDVDVSESVKVFERWNKIEISE